MQEKSSLSSGQPGQLVQPALPLMLTRQMIPAIYANVINRKVTYAILGLMVWGCWNILTSSAVDIFMSKSFDFPFWKGVRIIAQLSIGLIMWIMAIYGLVTRKPSVIIVDGYLTGLSAMVNLTCSAMNWVNKESAFFLFFWGFLQIFWSRQEFASYSVIKGWLPKIKDISIAERQRVKGIIKVFVRMNESFEAGRLVATVTRRHWHSLDLRRVFRGQIMGDDAIFLSKNLAHCFVVDRATAITSPFSDSKTTKVLSNFGFRTLLFWPISCVTWKHWIGRHITITNARQAVSHYALSVGLLRFLLSSEDIGVRLIAINAVGKFRDKALAGQIAVEMLADQAGTVRAAALKVCTSLKIDGLHERVIPMLQEPAVLSEATDYLAKYPSPDAIQPLRQLLIAGASRSAKRSLKKAIRACGGDENLYAMDVPVQK